MTELNYMKQAVQQLTRIADSLEKIEKNTRKPKVEDKYFARSECDIVIGEPMKEGKR